MGAFASWLADFAKSFLTWLYNHGIDFAQSAIDTFVAFVLSCVGLFPAAPSPISNGAIPVGPVFQMVITTINWLFPVAFLIVVIGSTVSAMLVYFGIAPVLRWLKVLT